MPLPITPSQKSLLDSFRCLRLSQDDRLLSWVSDFRNVKNENLVDYLQGDAFADDADGRVACYVVLDPKDEIICYFSLKTGILYSEFEELTLYEQFKKLKSRYIELEDNNHDEQTRKIIAKLGRQLDKTRDAIIKKLGNFDTLPAHKHVSTSYSAVELSHFCVNEAYRAKWTSLGFGRHNRIGLTIFWHIIYPKIIAIRNLIGCEYLYLFAADSTPDNYLVNHYTNFMGFREDMDVLAIQPMYDFRCIFLCNKIDSFAEHRDSFYLHFNENPMF